jgi:D-glycero-D-manno-heptose 1,7-bisphosphate phosphatase
VVTGKTSAAPVAVFLDRDGVLNRAIIREGRPFPPATLEEFEILPEVPEACKVLRKAGFVLLVVTNQPDIARGVLDRAVVDELHEFVLRNLPVDRVYICPHDDADGCECRKPGPGMLLKAADELGLDLEGSFMVGDRWRDVEAGRRAGCRTVFIDRGYLEPTPTDPDATVRDLGEAAVWITSAGPRAESDNRTSPGAG